MKLWNRILKGLKNNDLERLNSMIFEEQTRRANKRIAEGKFEPVSYVEKTMNRDKALDMYIKRTGCPKVMANLIFDNFIHTDTQTYTQIEI